MIASSKYVVPPKREVRNSCILTLESRENGRLTQKKSVTVKRPNSLKIILNKTFLELN